VQRMGAALNSLNSLVNSATATSNAEIDATPGPGQYDNDQRRRRPPAFAFGTAPQRPVVKQTECCTLEQRELTDAASRVPGPGAYGTPSLLGPKVPVGPITPPPR
jgi:hypothetical protein